MAATLEQSAPEIVGDPMRPEPFRIQRLRKETDDTFTLDLTVQNGSRPFRFQPGQFNMLYVFGAGEVPISISGHPAKKGMISHTTRVVGTVTKAMRKLKRGDTIGIRGPYGTAWPIEECQGRDVIFVAGGIGLAPLRPALYHILAHRRRYGRVVLLYGARTPEDVLYPRELRQWRSKFDLEVHVTVDRATTGWRGNVGVVTSLIPRAPYDPSSTIALTCGPEVMMRYTVRELQKRGVNSDRIYVSMERNMKCAVGFCGHCQYGPAFICKDGPVFRFDCVEQIIGKAEI